MGSATPVAPERTTPCLPTFAAPRRFSATTGISVTRDGVDHSEDVFVGGAETHSST